MRVSLLPVTSRVRSKLSGYRPLEESAERDVCIGPTETFPLPPAFYLSDQMDRVTGTHNVTASIAEELAAVQAPTLHNIETRAYLVHDAVIGHDRISNWSGFKDLTEHNAHSFPLCIYDEIDQAALCSTWQGNDYFAHFLFDDAATYPMAKRFAAPFFSGTQLPRSAHSLDYLSRFGCEYVERQNVFVHKLWFFRDFALGPSKRQRLQDMATLTKASVQTSTPAPGAFIRRGVSGQTRNLDNAAEIEAWCAQQGFVIVDPEHQTVDEICRALHEVPIVIGVEGSHLAHALFNMAEGGVMICVQPADRFNVIFRNLCGAMNLRWGFVVADGTIDGFHLDPSDLEKTLDLIESSTRTFH